MNFGWLFDSCTSFSNHLEQLDHYVGDIIKPNQIIMSETSEYMIYVKGNVIEKCYELPLNESYNKEVNVNHLSDITSKWFRKVNNEFVIRDELLNQLSLISKNRRKQYSPDYFKNHLDEQKTVHLKSIRFKYVNNEMVPYRYSIKK